MSEKDTYTRESDKRFTLRIEKDLFAKIEKQAAKDKRSIGREIEYILSQFVSSYEDSHGEISVDVDKLYE